MNTAPYTPTAVWFIIIYTFCYPLYHIFPQEVRSLSDLSALPLTVSFSMDNLNINLFHGRLAARWQAFHWSQFSFYLQCASSTCCYCCCWEYLPCQRFRRKCQHWRSQCNQCGHRNTKVGKAPCASRQLFYAKRVKIWTVYIVRGNTDLPRQSR